MRFHLLHIKGALTLATILITKETNVCGKSSNTVWPSSEAKPTNKSSSTKKRGLDQCSNKIDAANSNPECILDIPRGGTSPINSVVETTPYGIPLNGWKVILQLVLTAMNVICWFVPLQHTKLTDNRLGLSVANAFSGGVFLSLAFGHLIPECAHGFEELASVSSSSSSSIISAEKSKTLPYMMVLAGYLLIFFVEKVAFDTHVFADMHETAPAATENGDKKESKNESKQAAQPVSGRSAVILLLALGIHSVLEMMALGLANTFADSFLLFISIALHQPAESIALLIAFLKSGLPKRQIIQFLSVFSSLGLVGVLLGIYVKQYASPLLDACMLAIVAGTFVYVGATEIIPEEWEDGEHKWLKFGSLVSGIVTIFGITQYTLSLQEG